MERLGRLHCQLFLRLRCQHERHGSRHQRQLPALLRRGRCALPPPHRPGYPLARPLFRQRERPLPRLRRSDCLTTGLFCMSLEDGQKLIESLDGVEALWCTPDGEVIQSSAGPTTRKSNRKRKPPLRHGSCSNDEEGTFIYYISRISPRVHSSMQAYLAIRTAPPVKSAATSSTTQTDATALSRTDSESMTKWNR